VHTYTSLTKLTRCIDLMLLTNATIATMKRGSPYGLIRDGAVAIKADKILWVGKAQDVPQSFNFMSREDLEGRLITPGLIDCHTHVVHGGNRSDEFEMRLNGASYQEISVAGGGIVSTVKNTREASQEELLESALTRVDALLAEGVCVIEVKSGYGLDVETEIKMLRVARLIETLRPVIIRTSFLGAHAVPKEFKGRSDKYIDEVCIPALLAANSEGLVDAVDGFCEGIAFNKEQISRVFDVAHKLGLPIKLHAEQLSNIGGAQLAARYKALSADHLEYATFKDAEVMGLSKSVAVLLPGAFYTLGETQHPPVKAFRDCGVDIAIATDCNPGSSPLASLLLAMNMGCSLFKLTPEESLAGVTRNAARALGLSNRGKVEVGFKADLAVWDVFHPAELAYRIGFNSLYKRFFGGLEL
jgi:imidazolonepropionase